MAFLPLVRLAPSALPIYSPRERVRRRSHRWRRSRLRRSVVAVHEELREDSEVQHERAGAADQPAEVDKDVAGVDGAGLAGLAVAALVPVAVGVAGADGLEGEDAKDEGQVAKTGEEEEERVEALRALPAVVEQDLRQAAAEVEHGADVAEDLAPEAEFEGRGLVVGVGAIVVVRWRGGAEVVAGDAGEDDEHDGCAVEEDCLDPGARLNGLSGLDVVFVFGLRVHGRRGREIRAVQIGEVLAVSRRGTSALAVGIRGRKGSLQFAASTAFRDERRTL